MHKKYHEKFKILDILAVTTQAHEGIETDQMLTQKSACPRQKNENETQFYVLVVFYFIFAF